eukprot:jgi/Tetstr1/430012/TSEL_019873.t1
MAPPQEEGRRRQAVPRLGLALGLLLAGGLTYIGTEYAYENRLAGDGRPQAQVPQQAWSASKTAAQLGAGIAAGLTLHPSALEMAGAAPAVAERGAVAGWQERPAPPAPQPQEQPVGREEGEEEEEAAGGAPGTGEGADKDEDAGAEEEGEAGMAQRLGVSARRRQGGRREGSARGRALPGLHSAASGFGKRGGEPEGTAGDERARRRAGTGGPIKPLPMDAATIRNAAKALDIDLIKGAPRLGVPFDARYKNPCWTNSGGKLRCLPAFYILGSFQAGTANMYASLAAHPQVVSQVNARPHFWAEADKRMEAYVDGYSTPGALSALAAQPDGLLGDASASTLAFYWAAGQRTHAGFKSVIVPCWKNCTDAGGPRDAFRRCMDDTCFPAARAADRAAIQAAGIPARFAHLPLLMKAVYGSFTPRLIAILRDPVERFHYAFWSHPHYRDKYGATAEGFLAFAKEQIGEFEACEDHAGPLRCALFFEAQGQREEEVFFHCDQLIRGIYAVFLEVWMAAFGRDALLVLRAEDYFAAPGEGLAAAMAHLGLPGEPTPAMLDAGRRARSHLMAGKPGMLPEAAALVARFYAGWNQRLAALLRDRAFLWPARPAQ